MGIRTGAQYIEGLKDDRKIYVNGDLVRDVTAYPGFQGIIAEIGRHYDRYHDPKLQPRYTFPSPKDGKPVSNSYLQATTWEEMQQRVHGETSRKEDTFGLMGRMPDFMNAFVTDVAAVEYVVGHKDRQFAKNAIAYWEYCRDNDICLTHTLADPKRDYTKGLSEQRSIKIVKENDAGIFVSGARMLSTLAPVSHELWVGPFIPRQPGEEAYAVCFATPMDADGLKFVARETYATGRSHYDRPLSERFDEGDALAMFTNVFVPWEKVFCAGDLVAHNMMGPSFPGFLALQACIRGRAKLRFMTGLASKLAKTVGRDKMPRYQEILGELMGFNELADGLIEGTAREVLRNAQEVQKKNTEASGGLTDKFGEVAGIYANPDRSNVGMSMLRFFLPVVNTKANDAIRLLGSSSLVMSPTEADYNNPDISADLEEYISGPDMSAKDRTQVMKLAWDAVATQFGGRQEIYEIFFAGDPFQSRALHYQTPRREVFEAMVEKLLAGE